MKAVKGKFYFGGVHPRDNKNLSKAAASEIMTETESVAISTQQSLGRPAICAVTEGQTVNEGELIARGDGPVSSDVFSSVCGTVTEIKEMTGANGATETFILIKSDGRNDKTYLQPLSDPSPEDIKERIKQSVIVGLGGAG